jgi:hypothetical protein|eukprot:SAG25_NODE_520_length_7225_cov_3.754420_6_plen_72_part_00
MPIAGNNLGGEATLVTGKQAQVVSIDIASTRGGIAAPRTDKGHETAAARIGARGTHSRLTRLIPGLNINIA